MHMSLIMYSDFMVVKDAVVLEIALGNEIAAIFSLISASSSGI